MEPQILGERNRNGSDRCILASRVSPGVDRKRMSRLASALVVLALGAAPATASQQGIVATKNWKTMDLCAREAQAAFPDFTAEANAKRDAKLKDCLAGKNLPPRELPAPGR